MIRILIFLVILTALALGLAWLADRPGDIVLTWQGYHVETSLMVGLAGLLGVAIALMIIWSLLRFALRIPSLMSIWRRARRRQKGLDALSRGMVAAGAGDLRVAHQSSREAEKHLGDEPLALLLRAQVAQLHGDRDDAERTFRRMLEKPETRVLGLRGLHVEARRRGDAEAAHAFASQAHDIAPIGWAGQAVLEHHSSQEDWSKALQTVEANLKKKLIDKETARRQRAVLQTAIGMELIDRDPTEALSLAREAVKQAPELAPASVLLGRLLTRRGDLRRAAKALEAGWRLAPHPDIGRAYVEVRPGDSAKDRLARAQTLSRFAPDHPESRLLLARAALEARDFKKARDVMEPLVGERAPMRPTARACLMMADIEETEFGPTGALREWLSRAARAPRDPAWIADGVISDTWAPASPVTGKLDAFLWQTPTERLTQPIPDSPIEPSVAIPMIPIPPRQPEPPAAETPQPEPTPAAPASESVAIATAEPSAPEPAEVLPPDAPPPKPSARTNDKTHGAPDDPGPRR